MEVNTTANDESNGGENNYSEIRTADDARHVEVGDTVSLEINAYPERGSLDTAMESDPLVDNYEATVIDTIDSDPTYRDGVKLILDTGDEIHIVGTDAAHELMRGDEWYTVRDRHHPQNSIRLTVGPEVVTDGGVDVDAEDVIEALKLSNPISSDLFEVLDSDDEYLELQLGEIGVKLVHDGQAHAVEILNSMDADLHDPGYYEVTVEVAEMIILAAKESEQINGWAGFARGDYAEALDWDDFVPPQVV